MRILVTGGAGFIGSHLCERLIGDGHEIAIIDDLNDYYAPELKRQNLETVSKAGGVRFVEGDICDERRVGELCEGFRPEAIVHIAARAGVRPSLERPLLYERVNVGGTAVLLEAARKAGCGKFILASSSSIYGVANRVPFSEEDTSNHPISPYAASKLGAEKFCYAYSHLYGMKTICLRFFTVYGPRQRPDLAIRKFMERIEAGVAIPVFGDGSMGRDYTFVADTVSGIVGALGLDAAYEVINLGNSHPVGLMEMIRTIERVLGKEAIIDWKPEQPGDVPITFADISKAKRMLGYAPSTPFEEGIRRQAEWMRLAAGGG
ncbi:MAG: epimerase [Candidatus Solibacter sp.]|nr:epimerase [Candidatus Solibacter sp.]